MGLKFKIKKSKIEGKGAFAIKLIKKGELICRMKGEEVSSPELRKRVESGAEKRSDPLQIAHSKYLDLYEPYIFVNHSCDANAIIKNFNNLIALKNIKTGQEITFDYSLTEWSDRKFWSGKWSMECSCKSSSCRKVVREFYLLPKNIQKKYVENQLVQNHIIRKYKKIYGQ